MKSYLKGEKVYLEVHNHDDYPVVVEQVPWRGEHQPYFVACKKPDLLHCVNASMPLATIWHYKYELGAGEMIGGELYLDALFTGYDIQLILSHYVIMWYFETDYGNYTGVVENRD